MTIRIRRIGFLAVLVLTALTVAACGLMSPAKKPEVGPAGKPTEAKPNPPFFERFASAPGQLYDLEAIAGSLFAAVNKEDWPQAESGFYALQGAWEQTKPLVGKKKGVKEADEALANLNTNILNKKVTASYENLNKFMGAVGDIGKSYKLSPLSDIVAVGNAVRSVSFYVEDNNWSKAAARVKGLEDTWGHVKPSVEQVGILAAVTTAHSQIKQLKDAVNAENKGAVVEQVTNLNESLGKIREFYRGK